MLAEIGFVTAVEPLRSIAKEYPNILVRTKAVEALGRLGDARAVPLLIENTRNSYPQMRLSALGALRRVGAPDAIPALLKRMETGSLEEMTAAARAIMSAGPDGEREVRRLAHSDDRLVSRVAEQVMEEFRVGKE
jgi:HEAT repeat protein